MMNVLGEREKEKPCEFDFTRLFSSLMRIFDFGFSSYFRLGLDNDLYSHSIVPVGLGVISYSTRLMPSTSAVMRAVILCRTA